MSFHSKIGTFSELDLYVLSNVSPNTDVILSPIYMNPSSRRDHSAYAPGQWERVLQCNAVSNWLGTEWSLKAIILEYINDIRDVKCILCLEDMSSPYCRKSILCQTQNIHVPCEVGPWWRHQMETFSALLAICAGIHRSPVNSPHKDQWRGALMFSLICVCINGWVNNREAGDLRRYRAHYDVRVMQCLACWCLGSFRRHFITNHGIDYA